VGPIDIAYGKGCLTVEAAGDVLTPPKATPIADETGAVFDALDRATGRARLYRR